MANIPLTSELEFRHNLLKSRLKARRIDGHEEYYRLGKKVEDLGNFVLSNIGFFALEDISEFMAFYNMLELLRNKENSIEETTRTAEAIEDMIAMKANNFSMLYGYGATAVSQEEIQEIENDLNKIKEDLENSSIQYVMNSTRLNISEDGEIEELYSQATESVSSYISEVEKSLKDGDVSKCRESLERAESVLKVLNRLLLSYDASKIEMYKTALINMLSLSRVSDYKAAI